MIKNIRISVISTRVTIGIKSKLAQNQNLLRYITRKYITAEVPNLF